MGRNKIWICGSNGRLGQSLEHLLNPLDEEILSTDIDTVDVTNNEQVVLYALRNRPRVIINCAGLTDPFECEKDPKKAFSVNGLGARNVAVAAHAIEAKLIHLSTDDVFNRPDEKPVREYDRPNPATIYGKSKLYGEELVKDMCNQYFILRSSWLYSKENSVVESVIEKAKKKELIRVAKGQIGSPTSAYELARFIRVLMKTDEYGIYHASCEQYTSRKEFAETILKLSGLQADVIETEDSGKKIYRPDFACLENFMLKISDLYHFPHWKEALRVYLSFTD